MNTAAIIERLVKRTKNRAIRETLVGFTLMGYIGHHLQFVASGTPQFYGSLLIIVSLGFALGVIWSYVIGSHALRLHPATDSTF